MEDTRYKTFWRRFFALWIDGLILQPLDFITPSVDQESSLGAVTVAVALCVLAISYSTVMHHRYGQTVGKMVCNVMVVDLSEGRGPTWKQSVRRDSISYGFAVAAFVPLALVTAMDGEVDRWAVLLFASGLLVGIAVWSLGEVLTTLTNRRRRSLHDLIAGTVVVKLAQLSDEEILRLHDSLPGRQKKVPTAPAGRAVESPGRPPAPPRGTGW